tara:strand:- start:5689 stop:5943 length:255 start_codon:yes stop_codon:yes gene_type:complete
MGHATETGFADLDISKEDRLKIHLQGNFYPKHPKEVEESTIKGFNLYWDYKIDIEKLTEYCYLRDVGGLYRYYSTFLNEEDLEE